MNTAAKVDELITTEKSNGTPLELVAWDAAKACVGWAYVFGAAGEYCDIDNRKAYYARKGADHPTIKTACQIMMGKSSGCGGCKFYPGGKTRFFDCRGFTRWILKKVYGWVLQGGGATSQWNTASNWKSKGAISDGIPANTLVCLFVKKGNSMEHTGFGLNNETVECSAGVQYFSSRKSKWTHWGVPACVEGDVPVPEPTTKPTLRKGDAGPYVTLAQTELLQRGYDLGSYGADGKFGNATEKAVKQFQQDWGLSVDGVIGPRTWEMLDSTPTKVTYRVTIPDLSLAEANELLLKYPKGSMIKEGGGE